MEISNLTDRQLMVYIDDTEKKLMYYDALMKELQAEAKKRIDAEIEEMKNQAVDKADTPTQEKEEVSSNDVSSA